MAKSKEANIKDLQKVKTWMEENGFRLPTKESEDPEEQHMYSIYKKFRQKAVLNYLNQSVSSERREGLRKDPYFGEIITIIEWIEKNQKKPLEEYRYLAYAREIESWMNENERVDPPVSTSSDPEEKRLASVLGDIRQTRIKGYLTYESKGRGEEYKNQHPETEKVIEIIRRIDYNYLVKQLEDVRRIKAWMEERNSKYPPDSRSENEDEANLTKSYHELKRFRLSRYKKIRDSEERIDILEKCPEIEEIIELVGWIEDRKLSEKQRLKRLIENDRTMGGKVSSAKELHAKYQQALNPGRNIS